MTIQQAQQEYIEDFCSLPDWFAKYEYLIQLAKAAESLPEECKTEQTRLHGCQAESWLVIEYTDGKMYYRTDSTAIIVRAILAILAELLSDHTPEEIVSTPITFLEDAGIAQDIPPSRSAGIHAAIEQMVCVAKRMGGIYLVHRQKQG